MKVTVCPSSEICTPSSPYSCRAAVIGTLIARTICLPNSSETQTAITSPTIALKRWTRSTSRCSPNVIDVSSNRSLTGFFGPWRGMARVGMGGDPFGP